MHNVDRSRNRPGLKARLRRLVGDDIFISYSRADGSLYAVGLADELGERGFSCFIDQLGTAVGEDVPASLIERLQSCTACVVLVTPGVASSAAVRQEIEAFKETSRPIIPIRFDSFTESSALDAIIPGLAPSNEPRELLDTGVPSARVIARIEKSFNYTKRNQRTRWALGIAVTVLAALIGLNIVAGWRARREFLRATTQQSLADKATKEAASQTQIAETAKAEATKQTALAQAARIEAATERANADRSRQLADEQERLAWFRRTLAEAELERSQGVERVIVPVQKALEAFERYPSNEADPLLRYGVDRLPRLVASLMHPANVTAVASSPDGGFVSTLAGDSTARMWDVAASKVIATMQYDGTSRKAILSPDGQHVVVVGSRGPEANRFARVLAIRAEQEVARLDHDAPVADAGFSASGEYLATVSTDYVIKIWRLSAGADPDGGQPIRMTSVAVIQGEKHSVFERIVLSPDGGIVALVERNPHRDEDVPDSIATFWRVTPAEKVLEAEGLPTLSTRGRYFAYAHRDKVWVKMLDRYARPVSRNVEGARVSAMAFGPEERLFATGSANGIVRLYDLSNDGKEILRLDHQCGVRPQCGVTHVRFGMVSSMLSVLTITEDGVGHLWLRSERVSGQDGHDRFVEALVMYNGVERVSASVDGRYFATSGTWRDVVVWEKTFSGSVAGLAFDSPSLQGTFSADRRYVTVQTFAMEYRWDTRSRHVVGMRPLAAGDRLNSSRSKRVPTETGRALSPRGTRLAVTDSDGTAWVINTADGSRVGPLKHGTRTYGPESPRPQQTLKDGTVVVTGRSVYGYEAPVSHMAFTADDRYLATVATIKNRERSFNNGTIFVWDLNDGSLVVRIEHDYAVNDAAFTADSRHLVVIGERRLDHLLWRPNDLAAEARKRLAERDGRFQTDRRRPVSAR
jgi:WD40 repeat protein